MSSSLLFSSHFLIMTGRVFIFSNNLQQKYWFFKCWVFRAKKLSVFSRCFNKHQKCLIWILTPKITFNIWIFAPKLAKIALLTQFKKNLLASLAKLKNETFFQNIVSIFWKIDHSSHISNHGQGRRGNADFMIVKHRMLTRRRLLKRVCHKYSNPLRPENGITLAEIQSGRFVIFNKPQFAFCQIQKCASTSFQNFFLALGRRTGKKKKTRVWRNRLAKQDVTTHKNASQVSL